MLSSIEKPHRSTTATITPVICGGRMILTRPSIPASWVHSPSLKDAHQAESGCRRNQELHLLFAELRHYRKRSANRSHGNTDAGKRRNQPADSTTGAELQTGHTELGKPVYLPALQQGECSASASLQCLHQPLHQVQGSKGAERRPGC